MYDELIKALHEGAEFLECSTPGIKNSFAKMCHNAADAIEELSKPKWIPVTERLPEFGVRALCKCRANIYEVLTWTADGWEHDPQHIYMSGFVTHWMSLPTPPKEE